MHSDLLLSLFRFISVDNLMSGTEIIYRRIVNRIKTVLRTLYIIIILHAQ